MAQPFGEPILNSQPHDLYNIEDIRRQLLELQDTATVLVLSLNSIAYGLTTLRSSGNTLIELISPNAALARNIHANITQLNSIFETPVIQGRIFAGKTMKKKQRNTKEQRKTKRRRL